MSSPNLGTLSFPLYSDLYVKFINRDNLLQEFREVTYITAIHTHTHEVGLKVILIFCKHILDQ